VRWGTAAVAFVSSATVLFALSGCSFQPSVVEGSVVTFAIEQPVTSLNDRTSSGNSASNGSVAYATSSRFFYYNDVPELVRDESFGQAELVSESPLTVTYTVNDGVVWSDGAVIDASDLLLAWAANSGRFTTPDASPSDFFDALAGEYTAELPDGAVFFDGASRSGLQFVTELPQVGADGRSITLVFDEYFADWQLAFEVGVPAHVVALDAFPQLREDSGSSTDSNSADDAERETAVIAQAKATVLDAIRTADYPTLSALAVSWNTAFNLTEEAPDAALLVSSGPYTVTEIVPNESVTLTANPLYRGDHAPSVETIVVRTIADPLEVIAALADGSVDIATPAVSLDVASALDELDGFTIVRGSSGTFEHLDLQFAASRSGLFDDPLIREAFLLTIPRDAIVAELVAPVNPEAVTRDSFLFAPGSETYDDAVVVNGSAAFDSVNIARATELLAEAEVAEPRVCILFDPRNLRRVNEFTMIQESAAEAGFRVTDCSRPEWVDFLGVASAYDAALFGWNETNLAVSAPAARLRSDSVVSNLNYFASDSVDAALDAVNSPASDEKRITLFTEIDSELWSQGYGVPLFQYPSLTAVSDRVAGVSPMPLGPGIVWNIWEWQPVQVSESPAASR
jgi:peptide/nickel transport system substrate-binding protein